MVDDGGAQRCKKGVRLRLDAAHEARRHVDATRSSANLKSLQVVFVLCGLICSCCWPVWLRMRLLSGLLSNVACPFKWKFLHHIKLIHLAAVHSTRQARLSTARKICWQQSHLATAAVGVIPPTETTCSKPAASSSGGRSSYGPCMARGDSCYQPLSSVQLRWGSSKGIVHHHGDHMTLCAALNALM